MTDIKFARDYGYSPAAPFWLVWNEEGSAPRFKHPTQDAAQAEAARLASENPGSKFHVLCPMATISTSMDIVGVRFDPSRAPPSPEPAPVFIEEASSVTDILNEESF
jgi:hypothetical protein